MSPAVRLDLTSGRTELRARFLGDRPGRRGTTSCKPAVAGERVVERLRIGVAARDEHDFGGQIRELGCGL
jgi:hypothetical protein